MRVWIGTAGYTYPEWVGGFYPPGISTGRMLPWYASTFPVVELNSTVYHCPTVAMVERLADQAPPGFRFAVRVPKSITHEQNDRDVELFQEAVFALGGRLAMLVAQFPASFHHSRQHRGWLNRLAGMFDAGFPLGIEFRHWSWARPDVPHWLGELGLQAISVDVPSIPTLYPRGLVRANKCIYVRFHSRNADAWFRPDAERHDYIYTDLQLREWADLLERESATCEDAYLIFNHGRDLQAVENGQRMIKLLRERTWLSVVPAFAGPLPQQMSLFEV